MSIRLACRDELEAGHRGTGRPWLAAACEGLRLLPEHPGGRVLIAEEDGQPRAVLGLELIWAGSGQLVMATIRVLAVDPDHNYRGIGSRLVRFAEGIARINGCEQVHVAPGLEQWGHGRCWYQLGYDDPGHGLLKALESPIQKTCA